mmetsp:Transcript_42900/g.100718  ORF Transcript_42900/g.100718 Transcript_42900/m.100718 type:complete len:245 (-) Transcript_42900:161-895(-)
MITFLPYADFNEVARCLDDKRLGAQRYESWSILKWLRAPEDYPKLVRAGYCSMWRGYEDALVRYINAMLCEWAARGMRNELLKPFDPERGLDRNADKMPAMPPWLGVEEMHSYHRHALVAKHSTHYCQFGWHENGTKYNGSYLWPVRVTNNDADESKEEWMLRWPKSMKRPLISISKDVNSKATGNIGGRFVKKEKLNLSGTRKLNSKRNKGISPGRASHGKDRVAYEDEKNAEKQAATKNGTS